MNRRDVARAGERRVAWLGALLLAGCAGEARSAAEVPLEALPRSVLVEERRIGSAEDPAEGFTRIGGVAVSPAGSLYVLESADRHVRVFDAEGRRTGTIGGPGDGPGEFRLLGGTARYGFAGDTLWFNDPGAARVTLFSPDGAVLSTQPTASFAYEAAPGVSVMLRPASYLGGGLFSSTWAIPAGAMSTISTSPSPVLSPVVRMHADGTVVDTIRWERLRGSSPLGVEVMGQRVTVPQAPDAQPLALDTPSGTYLVDRPIPTSAEGGRLTVVLSSGGDTLYRRELDYTPRPWSPAHLTSLMEPALRVWANRVGPGADTALAAAAVREALPFPPLQPPVSGLHLGADQVLWMAREPDPAAPTTWIRIDPAGTPIDAVEVPPRTTLHWSVGETVWASVLDELDVPWLVRYRIAPTGEGR